MRVALLGPTHPHRGGIAHYTTLLARSFAKSHETHIVSFTRLYPGILFPGATQFDRSAEALLPPVDPERLLDSVNPLTWRRAGMRLRALDPDILIVPWWHPFFGPSLGTAARIAKHGSRPKRIFLTHNVEPHEATPVDRWLAGYGLGAADGFLVHARAEAERRKLRADGRPGPSHRREFFSEPGRRAARAAISRAGGSSVLRMSRPQGTRTRSKPSGSRAGMRGTPRRGRVLRRASYDAILRSPAPKERSSSAGMWPTKRRPTSPPTSSLPHRPPLARGSRRWLGAGVPVMPRASRRGLEGRRRGGFPALLVGPPDPKGLRTSDREIFRRKLRPHPARSRRPGSLTGRAGEALISLSEGVELRSVWGLCRAQPLLIHAGVLTSLLASTSSGGFRRQRLDRRHAQRVAAEFPCRSTCSPWGESLLRWRRERRRARARGGKAGLRGFEQRRRARARHPGNLARSGCRCFARAPWPQAPLLRRTRAVWPRAGRLRGFALQRHRGVH